MAEEANENSLGISLNNDDTLTLRIDSWDYAQAVVDQETEALEAMKEYESYFTEMLGYEAVQEMIEKQQQSVADAQQLLEKTFVEVQTQT